MKTTIANPVNTTNAMGKKRKRPKNMHKSKKDEENILSKDIEDDNIRYMMDTKKNIKPREDLKTTFTLKNLRFKPQKYKGSFLPYHLRWIFNNNVKSHEIVLLNEIEGLENEISRLKSLKLINRECRKLAGLPFGITTNFCQCCHLFEKKKHNCSHKYCNDKCPRKKAEELMSNLLKNNKLKETKDGAPKDRNNIKIFNDIISNNINNKLDLSNQNNDIQQNLNNESLNINNSNLENKIDNEIILDKNMNINNNILENNNINDSNKFNSNSQRKKLIFGTVERSNKEKKKIFLVKYDLSMIENNRNSVNYGNESSHIKSNEDNEDNNNDDSQDNDNNKDDYENYTVNIESSEEEEMDEIIDINKENEDEEKNENKTDRNNNDKENEEDDVIIINQTTPQNIDKEN